MSDDRIVRFDSREEWLAWRSEPGQFRIGASEAAAALGMSKWIDPWELYAKHRHPEYVVKSSNDARKEQGLAWEAGLIAMYNSIPEFCNLGHAVAWPLQVIRHPRHPWLFATLDATIGADGILELKTDATPGAREAWGQTCSHQGYGPDVPCPPWYAVQCAVQMACSERMFNDLMVSIPAFGGMPELRRIRLISAPDAEESIVEAVADWRERHLVGGVDPEPVSDEVRLRSLAWRYPKGREARRATAEEAVLMEALANVMDQEDEVLASKESLRAPIAELMARSGAEKVFCAYGTVTRTKTSITFKRK